MHFTIYSASGYFKEKNRDKYLAFASTHKNNEVLAKYAELWNIKYLIKTIDGQKEIDHRKDLMKIKSDTDDELPFD